MHDNQSQFRLIASDMDGTLLNGDNEVSLENRKWIQEARKAGVAFVLSTGRGRQSVLSYVEELGLDGPMVLVNGSEIWTAPDKLYRRITMPVELIREMRSLALAYDVWYWGYTVDGVLNRESWPSSPKREEELTWLKFGIYTENPDKLPAIRRTLDDWGVLEVTNSHPCNIEMNPKGANKGYGVSMVCRLLGLEMSQAIAVGDSFNDLSMIRQAGLGVAIGNAQEEIKAAADVVAPANEEDGVAWIIKKYIFGQEDGA